MTMPAMLRYLGAGKRSHEDCPRNVSGSLPQLLRKAHMALLALSWPAAWVHAFRLDLLGVIDEMPEQIPKRVATKLPEIAFLTSPRCNKLLLSACSLRVKFNQVPVS